jgi:hypothetical protein
MKYVSRCLRDVQLLDSELAARRAAWTPPQINNNSGAVWKYAQAVGPAHFGAVTHPGAAETQCYEDVGDSSPVAWTKAGDFCGIRGKSVPLNGVRFRLGDAAPRTTLSPAGRPLRTAQP